MAVAELGYKIDSTGVVSATKDLLAMDAAAGEVEQGQSVLAPKVKKTSVELVNMAVAADNVAAELMNGSRSATIATSTFSGLGNEIVATLNETKLLQREMDGLRAKFNPLFAVSKQYELQLEEIASAERLGAISAMEAAAARDRATQSMNKANSQMLVLGGTAKVSSGHVANLGAQFNDIGVMLAAGQSPLMLAVQQGTQINQVMAQMGGGRLALRGLAAGFMSTINPMSLATLGIIAGGAALIQWGSSALSAGEDADKLEDLMGELADTISMVEDATDLLLLTTDELVEKYGAATERVRQFALAQAEIAASQAGRRMAEQVSLLDDVIGRYTLASNAGHSYKNTINSISKEFGIATTEAREFETLLGDLEASSGLLAQQEALENVLEFIEKNNIELDKIPDELQRAISEMITYSNEADRARALTERLAAAAANVTIGFPLFKQGMFGHELLPPPPSDEPPDRGRARPDKFKRDLERLQESLRTERETVDIWYAEQQEILNNQRALEILGVDAHNEAKERLEKEHLDRLSDIQGGYQGSALNQAQTFFGDMASALQGGNDKMAKAAAVFGALEATINAYRAFNQVLADPSLPWFAKIPAGLGVLAAGLKTVQSIKALGGGSGGGGGGGGRSSPPSAVGPGDTGPQQRAIIQISGGRSRFTIEEMNDIISGIQQGAEDGVIIEGFTRA